MYPPHESSSLLSHLSLQNHDNILMELIFNRIKCLWIAWLYFAQRNQWKSISIDHINLQIYDLDQLQARKPNWNLYIPNQRNYIWQFNYMCNYSYFNHGRYKNSVFHANSVKRKYIFMKKYFLYLFFFKKLLEG